MEALQSSKYEHFEFFVMYSKQYNVSSNIIQALAKVTTTALSQFMQQAVLMKDNMHRAEKE